VHPRLCKIRRHERKDRAEFLKNAERWSQCRPKERQAWRDLVAQRAAWPPLPTASIIRRCRQKCRRTLIRWWPRIQN
jgi:hypothetical protein